MTYVCDFFAPFFLFHSFFFVYSYKIFSFLSLWYYFLFSSSYTILVDPFLIHHPIPYPFLSSFSRLFFSYCIRLSFPLILLSFLSPSCLSLICLTYLIFISSFLVFHSYLLLPPFYLFTFFLPFFLPFISLISLISYPSWLSKQTQRKWEKPHCQSQRGNKYWRRS